MLTGGEVVWPDGCDPDDDEELPLPVSIGGKKVIGIEDGAYLGEDLVVHSDDATATFHPGEYEEARTWLESYYENRLDDPALASERIKEALQSGPQFAPSAE